uniref:Uncharacterized protein n=1 Tax=Neobacillus citreus TaxID=2833578 RepID=A0A942SY71_9BACI
MSVHSVVAVVRAARGGTLSGAHEPWSPVGVDRVSLASGRRCGPEPSDEGGVLRFEFVVRRFPDHEFARRSDEHRGERQGAVERDGRHGHRVRPAVRPEDRRVVGDRVRDAVAGHDQAAVVVDVLHAVPPGPRR